MHYYLPPAYYRTVVGGNYIATKDIPGQHRRSLSIHLVNVNATTRLAQESYPDSAIPSQQLIFWYDQCLP